MAAHRACVLLAAVSFCVPASLPAVAGSESAGHNALRQSILRLPSQPNEHELSVELIPGQHVCSSTWLLPAAVIQPRRSGDRTTYVAAWEGATPQSCAAEERNGGVVSGKSLLIAYDSRLPLVLAAPETLEISYRIIGPDGAEPPRPLSLRDADAWLAASDGNPRAHRPGT